MNALRRRSLLIKGFAPVIFSLGCTTLMILAAWWKRGAPAGSLLAPMPGLVLRVLAEVGAVVTAGQPLLVLEAMKMEQTVSAPANGVVAELHAKAGEQVSTGQVLAVLESGG